MTVALGKLFIRWLHSVGSSGQEATVAALQLDAHFSTVTLTGGRIWVSMAETLFS